MGTRRTGIVLVALLVGLVAAGAVYEYLATVQERANEGARLVKVFFVTRDIPKGMAGERALEGGWVRPSRINLAFKPRTAVPDADVIRGKVAVSDLAAHQVLVERQFVDPAVALVTSAGRIPAGQVAITLSFDPVTGVAGLIQPGDKVNMLVLLKDQERYLLQNVNVLFVGSRPAPQPGETQTRVDATAEAPSDLITFAVSPENALKIAYASHRSDERGIHLALVPPDNRPVPAPSIDDETLIGIATQTG